jgi:DNA topoisomerase-3
VVDRFKEIENFKSPTLLGIANLVSEKYFSYEEGRFFKKEDGQI